MNKNLENIHTASKSKIDDHCYIKRPVPKPPSFGDNFRLPRASESIQKQYAVYLFFSAKTIKLESATNLSIYLMSDLHQQINSSSRLDKLKAINRKALIKADQNRYENSAEHSWHIALKRSYFGTLPGTVSGCGQSLPNAVNSRCS